MVTTRTGSTYSAASSSKPRSKNVRLVDIQLQPGTYDPPTECDVNSNSSMHLPQDSVSLVHDSACPVISARCPLAAISSRLSSPPHEISEPANSDVQRNAHANTPDGSVYIFREPADSSLGEAFALIAQEPVEPGLEENGDSRQTPHADLPSKVQTAEPTPLQGTQSTEPGSQESGTGLAESPPGEPWGTATSISEETFTAGATLQQEELTNCDPREIQPTTSQRPELSDLAPHEPVGCHNPQETNSISLVHCATEIEIEIIDLTGCQGPEADPQVPETAYCIRPQGPEIPNPAADEIADAGHCDTTNVNPLTIADPSLPKLSTTEVESPEAEAANLDALETKTTNPTQEPGVTNINHHETTEVIPPKTADPFQEPQAALSVPQESRRSNSEEAGHSRAHLTIDRNSEHSPTGTGPAFDSLGDTNENPIVLDDSSAGDSRYNPIEIPDDPITQRSRKRRYSSDGGDGRYKFRCRTESYQRSQSPFVPWAQANLYLPG